MRPASECVVIVQHLWCFHTSSSLAALPLRRVITTCHFMLIAPSSNAALAYRRAALLPGWIEVNCLRSAAVGKAVAVGLSIYWQDAACCFIISVQQVVCAVAQISSSTCKLVWKQHYTTAAAYPNRVGGCCLVIHHTSILWVQSFWVYKHKLQPITQLFSHTSTLSSSQ